MGSVGAIVGDSVGSGVGSFVGVLVGDSVVGEAVGAAVGSAVGAGVGAGVGLRQILPFPSTVVQVRAPQHWLLSQLSPRLEHFGLMHFVRLTLEILPAVHFLHRRRPAD